MVGKHVGHDDEVMPCKSDNTDTRKKGARARALVSVVAVVVALLVVASCGSSGSSSSADGSSTAAEDSATAFNPDDYQQVDYATLAQRPDDYQGQKLYFAGQVVQIDESGSPYIVRLATSTDGYDDIVWVEIDPSLLDGNHIVDDQYIGVYGTCNGQQTYTSTLGGSISIPSLTADAVNLDVKSPQEEQNEAITALFDGITFQKSDDGYGYYTYSATVTNTTENNYSDVSLVLGLYDANGTRAAETYASVNSWAAGESVVFEGSSDTDAAQVQAQVEYYQIGDEFYSVD